MNFKLPRWAEGLLVAALSSGLIAAAEAYNTGQTEWNHLKGAAIGGAVVGVLAWLRQKPADATLPPPQDPSKG